MNESACKFEDSPVVRSMKPIFARIASACILLPCFCHAQSAYRIAGVVVSKIDGQPLARVRVTVSDTTNVQKSVSVITGDDGRFQFTAVPAGKYSLNGAKRSFVSSYYDQHENYWTGIVTGAGVDTENLVLKLTPSAAIAGEVLDESGDPVRAARVSLYRVDHSEGLEQIRNAGFAQTDDLGTYEFPSLNAGTYFVSASAQPWYALHPQRESANAGESPNFDRTLDVSYPITYYADTPDADSATPIPIRGGERVQVDLHLSPVPGLHLTFHVGNSKDGATFVRLEQPAFDGSNPLEAGAVRSSPGVLEMSGIPAGRYDVLVQTPTGIAEMSNIDLTRDGQQVDASTAQSFSNVKITARMSDGSAAPRQLMLGLTLKNKISPRMAVAADEKGQIELAQVSEGSYQIVAWGAGKPLSIAQVSAEGAEVTGHTIAIAAGTSASLSVTLSAGSAELDGVVKHAGKPFGGAMVVLVPKDPHGNRDLFRRDQSDLDGTFALHNVIPGSYTLIAIENGWDLDWSQPDVIAAYAKHGQLIQVRKGVNIKIHIARPVETEPR